MELNSKRGPKIEFEKFETSIRNLQVNNNMNSINTIPGEETKTQPKVIREIMIDNHKAKNQTKIIIDGIEIYFPYEPYECQRLYMKKSILIYSLIYYIINYINYISY